MSGLTLDEKMVNVYAKALICELHDSDYWPNEAELLARSLDKLGLLPERVRGRLHA